MADSSQKSKIAEIPLGTSAPGFSLLIEPSELSGKMTAIIRLRAPKDARELFHPEYNKEKNYVYITRITDTSPDAVEAALSSVRARMEDCSDGHKVAWAFPWGDERKNLESSVRAAVDNAAVGSIVEGSQFSSAVQAPSAVKRVQQEKTQKIMAANKTAFDALPGHARKELEISRINHLKEGLAKAESGSENVIIKLCKESEFAARVSTASDATKIEFAQGMAMSILAKNWPWETEKPPTPSAAFEAVAEVLVQNKAVTQKSVDQKARSVGEWQKMPESGRNF